MSIGSVAESPADANTVVVGTGVSEFSNWSNDKTTNSWGNGIWYTHNALSSPQTWTKATIPGGDPHYVIKVRYNSDASKVIAATSSGLLIGTQDGSGVVSFMQAGSSCQPMYGGYQFTDLVTDPSAPNSFYVGVSGEGVYHSTDGGQTCTSSAPGPLYSGDGVITNVALAIASDSRLYASIAGTVFDDGGDDFQGIFTTSTWPPSWATALAGGPIQHLRSQGSHNWALSTSPGGGTVLAAGVGIWRFTGCPANCGNGQLVDGGHADFHAVLYGSDNIVYAVNDGGLFTSSDDGVTWAQGINTLGVANEISVAVNNPQAPHIFASAWDVGVNYTLDGTAWLGIPNAPILDGHQVVANDAYLNTQYVFACGNDGNRQVFNGSTWSSADNPQIAPSPPAYPGGPRWCNIALSTVSGASPSTIYNNQLYYTFDNAQSWYPFGSLLPGGYPWSVVRGNDPGYTMYVAVVNQQALDVIWASAPNGWQYAAVPPGWTAGYAIGGTWSGAVMALDSVTGDAYLVGTNASHTGAIVSAATASSHGGAWNTMTGSGALMLSQSEYINAIAVDPSTRGVIVGTEGHISGGGEGNSIYRVNNQDVTECPLCNASHHWRPWVYGLPNGTQPVTWITGQYENGVYYYYAATWGRGIWKREARGGDF